MKNQTIAQANKLKQMKFQDPKQSKQELQAFFSEFVDEISTAFKKLMDKWLSIYYKYKFIKLILIFVKNKNI